MTYKIDPAIYKITNSVNGKFYIGSAMSVTRRWQKHRWKLEKNIHENEKLQRAWNKYGSEAFSIEVIESVSGISALVEREQFWIDRLDPCVNGYNIAPIAGSTLGYKHTDESKKKMSLTHKGEVLPDWHKAKLIAANSGRVQTEEEKLRRVISSGNKPRQKVVRGNNPGIKKGTKKTPEHIAKIAEAHRGMKRSKEACRNIGNAVRGRRHSEATKKKMSEARKGIKFSDEQRENMAKAARERWTNKRAQQS